MCVGERSGRKQFNIPSAFVPRTLLGLSKVPLKAVPSRALLDDVVCWTSFDRAKALIAWPKVFKPGSLLTVGCATLRDRNLGAC